MVCGIYKVCIISYKIPKSTDTKCQKKLSTSISQESRVKREIIHNSRCAHEISGTCGPPPPSTPLSGYWHLLYAPGKRRKREVCVYAQEYQEKPLLIVAVSRASRQSIVAPVAINDVGLYRITARPLHSAISIWSGPPY